MIGTGERVNLFFKEVSGSPVVFFTPGQQLIAQKSKAQYNGAPPLFGCLKLRPESHMNELTHSDEEVGKRKEKETKEKSSLLSEIKREQMRREESVCVNSNSDEPERVHYCCEGM